MNTNMNKEEIIDAILELNFKFRSCEESLMLVLEKFDESIQLDRVTDQTMLQYPPITTLEGVDVILQRLGTIEDMLSCLVNDRATAVAMDILAMNKIIKE